MTLTAQEVRKHVMEYLEATECTVIEVSPLHVTVKLSPRADRMLTDRPYYWGFVERTGAAPGRFHSPSYSIRSNMIMPLPRQQRLPGRAAP